MLGLSMVVLIVVLILTAMAATIALVSCVCLKNWDSINLRKGRRCLIFGFVAVLICLSTTMFFYLSDVAEYINLVSACLAVSIIIFCSYVIFSITIFSHKHNDYIRELLSRSRTLTDLIESDTDESDGVFDDITV